MAKENPGSNCCNRVYFLQILAYLAPDLQKTVNKGHKKDVVAAIHKTPGHPEEPIEYYLTNIPPSNIIVEKILGHILRLRSG